MPIPLIDINLQKQVAALVDEVIKSKEKSIYSNTGNLEQSIDNLIYQCFGLTEEEIAIIES